MPDCQHPTLKAEPTHPARPFPTQSSALCSRCSVNLSVQVYLYISVAARVLAPPQPDLSKPKV